MFKIQLLHIRRSSYQALWNAVHAISKITLDFGSHDFRVEADIGSVFNQIYIYMSNVCEVVVMKCQETGI